MGGLSCRVGSLQGGLAALGRAASVSRSAPVRAGAKKVLVSSLRQRRNADRRRRSWRFHLRGVDFLRCWSRLLRSSAAPTPPFCSGDVVAQCAGGRPLETTQWWRTLHDRELNSLVDRAIAASPTLEIALDRLQQARAQEAVVIGAALPQPSGAPVAVGVPAVI